MAIIAFLGSSGIRAIEEPTCLQKYPKDFELSNTEKAEIEKFINGLKSSNEFNFNKIADSAFDGNPVAMYLVGQMCLTGSGGATINRTVAMINFGMAASLGYAPALMELSVNYATEQDDPLLSLVYMNLLISYGHTEYREFYYGKTNLLSKIAGRMVVKEIENIAIKKAIKISEMQEELSVHKNIYKPAIKLIGTGITFCDSLYDKEYWKQFFDSEQLWRQFFGVTE
jgi:hypothetical protein